MVYNMLGRPGKGEPRPVAGREVLMATISSSTLTRISGMEPKTAADLMWACGIHPIPDSPGIEVDQGYPGVRLIHERMPDGSWSIALEVLLSHDFEFRRSRFYQHFHILIEKLGLNTREF